MTRSLLTNSAILIPLALAALSACQKDATTAQTTSDSTPKPPALEPKRSFTDPEVNAAVLATLARDPGVDATNIHVKTTQGIVELTGQADNLLTKRRAARVAEAVRGVRAVSDQTTLQLKSRADAEVTADVNSALLESSVPESYRIVPKTKAGTVTLTGNMKSYQERLMAERLTEGVRGVRAVDNQIAIQHGVARSDSSVAADVTSRLRWDALVNDGLIDVAVHDGIVTLTGKVASAAERRRADVDAWVLGAATVDDSGLTVDWAAQEADLRRHKLLGRSDGQIASAIHDAAAYDPRVSVADMLVSVTNGNAVLRGSVPSLKGRIAAEDVARHTVGVLGVQNELVVKPGKTPSDAALVGSVKHALLWDPYTNVYPIDVQAKAGKVTLTGSVDTPYERAQATDVAAEVEGVKGIDNSLKVKRGEQVYVYSAYLFPYSPYWESWYAAPSATKRSDTQIAEGIHEELLWSPFIDAERVKVDVTHGGAKLTGQVESQSERIAATEDAYEGGALTVDNELKLSSGG
jgi:osmotically-inducible protein OsmY